MYGNRQSLYGTNTYRNASLSPSYNPQNKNIEYQNISKSSQLNMV